MTDGQGILYVRPTKRVSTAQNPDDRTCASNSRVEVIRSTTNCLICQSVTTGSNGSPNSQTLLCRPVAGWQAYAHLKKGRTTSVGEKPDLVVPNLERRAVAVIGIPIRERGKKGQKSTGSSSKMAPLHQGLDELVPVPIAQVLRQTGAELEHSDSESHVAKRARVV